MVSRIDADSVGGQLRGLDKPIRFVDGSRAAVDQLIGDLRACRDTSRDDHLNRLKG
jgi:hypothetical protein